MLLVLLALSQNGLGAMDGFAWATGRVGLVMSDRITDGVVVPLPSPSS